MLKVEKASSKGFGLFVKEELKKGDYDLLLRKAVESKVPEFRLFCEALVKYCCCYLGRAPMSTSSIPRVTRITCR